MTARFIIGVVALVCGTFLGMSVTFMIHEVVDEVNVNLPREQQFSQWGWYLFKYLRLHREYKRLYPNGRILLRSCIATALMFVCLLVCGWAFGFFAR
jgi:hypothetical protein